jgi:hypothetical protein
MSDHANVATAEFWAVADALLAEDGVVQGTVMNFPCLRQGTEFFGMPHHETGSAVLKLPRERVAALVAAGIGQPFGPGGKVFKEWVLVPKEHRDRWLDLLREARTFVS